jgi:hypothetical protein
MRYPNAAAVINISIDSPNEADLQREIAYVTLSCRVYTSWTDRALQALKENMHVVIAAVRLYMFTPLVVLISVSL